MYSKEQFSQKATWLSVMAMASVVILHSTACLTVEKPAAWNVFVQYLVTRSFTYWAVPFFFAMSGFWFARGGYMQGKEALTCFFKKKPNTSGSVFAVGGFRRDIDLAAYRRQQLFDASRVARTDVFVGRNGVE